MADKKISALTAASTPLAGTEVLPVVQSSATVKVSVANLTNGRVVDTAGLTVTDYAGAVAAINVSGAGTLPARIRAVSTTTAGASLVLRDSGTTNNVTLLSSGQDLVIQTGGVQRVNFSGGGDLTMLTGNVIQGTAAKGVNFTANTPATGMTSQLLNWYEEGTWTPAVVSSSGTITSVTGNVGRYTRVGRSITCVFNFTISNNGTGAGALFITGLPFVGSQAVLTYYAVFGWNRVTGMSLAGEYNPGTGGTGRIALYKYDATYPVATGDACECVVTYEV